MKVTVEESEGCFSIHVEAEDIKEAAVLTRMGMNARKEVRSFSTDVFQDGTFSAYVVFGKHRKANSGIIRRR